MRNSNAQFSNAFGTRIGSGSDFEEEEVGWDLPLIQLENDLHPLTRYIRRYQGDFIKLLSTSRYTCRYL